MYPEDSARDRFEVGKSSFKSNWMFLKIKYNMTGYNTMWYDMTLHNTTQYKILAAKDWIGRVKQGKWKRR